VVDNFFVGGVSTVSGSSSAPIGGFFVGGGGGAGAGVSGLFGGGCRARGDVTPSTAGADYFVGGGGPSSGA